MINVTRGNERVFIELYGSIGESIDPDYANVTASELASTLNRYQGEDILLIITSPGGYINEAKAMLEAISSFNGNIETYVPEYVGSCATLLALSGSKLYMNPDSWFFIHSAYLDFNDLQEYFGKLNEGVLNEVQKELNSQNDFICNYYAEHSNTDAETFRQLISSIEDDTYLDADDLLGYGFNCVVGDPPYSKLAAINLAGNKEDKSKFNKLKWLNMSKIAERMKNSVTTEGNKATEATTASEAHKTEVAPQPQVLATTTPVQQVSTSTTSEQPLRVDIEVQTKAQMEEATLKIKEQLATEQAEIFNIFRNYLHKPEYADVFQQCLKAHTTPTDARLRLLELKASESEKSVTNTVVLENATKNARSKVISKDELLDALNYKINPSGQTYEDLDDRHKYLATLSFLDLIEGNLRSKNVSFTTFEEDGSQVNFTKNLSSSDYGFVIDQLTNTYWLGKRDYLLQSLDPLIEVVKCVGTNPVKYFDETSGIDQYDMTPEGTLPFNRDLVLEAKEYKAEIYQQSYQYGWVALMNDQLGILTKLVKKLTEAALLTVHDKIIECLFTYRNEFTKVSGITAVNIDTFAKVENEYASMRDAKDTPISVKPDYLVTSKKAQNLYKAVLGNQFDTNAGNDITINFYQDYVKLIADVGVTAVAERLNLPDCTNDAFFLPAKSIKVLAHGGSLKPTIKRATDPLGQVYIHNSTLIFGTFITRPKDIVYVPGKDIEALKH